MTTDIIEKVKDSEKCAYCEDELEEQNIYNRRIQVVDEFKHVKWEYLFCSRNCMINFFETDLKEITDIRSSEAVEACKEDIRKKIESILKDHAFWYSEGNAVYCRCEFRWGTYLKWVEHRDQKLLEIIGESKA